MKTKVCIKCNKELPATSDFFQPRKEMKDGFRGDCRVCNNKACKKYKTKYSNESLAEYGRKYYDANKITVIKKNIDYQRIHLEDYRILEQKRRAKELQLPYTLSLDEWESVKRYFDNKCCYCGKEKVLEQEHFIPLNSGGDYTANNILCSCKSCNSSKKASDFAIWYPKHKFYNKLRELKILSFINKEVQHG